MAVDFDALDLVRGENKSRLYNKKLQELTQRNQSLQELVQDAMACVEEMERPSHIGRSISLKDRLQKIKKSS